MKLQKIMPALLGVVLIVFGCVVLFDSLNILPKLWLMPVAGLGILMLGLKSGSKALRDIGVVCLVLGVSVVINALFIHPLISSMFYLAAVAVAIYCISVLRKSGWLFLLGSLVLFITGTIIIESLDLPRALETAYNLILYATFAVMFVVKNEKFGYSPIIVGVFLYLMSLPYFLQNAGYITQTVAQIISAGLLIVAGAMLVILVYKKFAKENESE